MHNVSAHQLPRYYLPRGVVIKVLHCDSVVSEFEHQLRRYVRFRVNTIGKGMKLIISPAMG